MSVKSEAVAGPGAEVSVAEVTARPKQEKRAGAFRRGLGERVATNFTDLLAWAGGSRGAGYFVSSPSGR